MANETLKVEDVLDLVEAMGYMDGDAELLQEIVEIFLETAGEQLASIGEGISSDDIEKVAIQSHAMKGGASNFCARRFVASAARLEELTRKGTLDGAEELLQQMRDDHEEIVMVSGKIDWAGLAE
ncbi:MAG: HPt (histidine-containing phosphotransfer) domain-containing protein [Candidatus Krumholzibacteriia bacterium]|jgi:HPt (histidine-containing phosphotransfer) domain-containing protein